MPRSLDAQPRPLLRGERLQPRAPDQWSNAQSHKRVVLARERLHAAITEGCAIRAIPIWTARSLRPSPSPPGGGGRIDKAAHDAQVDAVIALTAALEGAKRQPVVTRLVGWL